MIGFEMDLHALSAELEGLPDQVDRAMAGITREAAQTFAGRMVGRFPANDDSGELRQGRRGQCYAPWLRLSWDKPVDKRCSSGELVL